MEETIIKDKAKVFFNNNTFTFIKLTSGKVYNGRVIEVGDNYLVLKDIMIGKAPFMFIEIEKIEPSEKKREGE